MKRTLLLVLIWYAVCGIVVAQNVPLTQWETHFSYLSAKHLVQAKNRIFCASHNGLFSIKIDDKQIRKWSKADGLNDSGISAMAFHEPANLLLLAYRNGNLDLVYLNDDAEPDQIINWPILAQNSEIPEIKDIRRIIFKENHAYLCTSFGIVVLDTENQQVEETYRYIGSNGAQVAVSDIAFISDSIFAVTNTGIRASSMSASVNRQDFANWKTLSAPGKVNAIATFGSGLYAGIAGRGIYLKEGQQWKSVFSSSSQKYAMSTSNNALLAALDDRLVVLNEALEARVISSSLFGIPGETLQTGDAALWMADAQNGLLYKNGSDFETLSPIEADTCIIPRPDSSVTDANAVNWTRLPEYLGGGILVKNASNQQRMLTTNVGSGSLPSSMINSLAVAPDGYVWFASDRGVGYFPTDNILNVPRADAVLPIFGERRLFANEKCTAIAIEPGNRKWIGTRNGLYLFNEDGTEMIRKFTAADSPLPSDVIVSLKFDAGQGMVYIDTPNGMVSYRSTSAESSENFATITIFPNPVHPGYAGTVGIKGLMDKSIVKITELSGRLVYETKSQGGIASWNLTDYKGKRPKGGVYMVLIVSPDGNEKFAGKLAIID